MSIIPITENPSPNPSSIPRKFPSPCWAQDETLVLISTYQTRWYSLNRGYLRSPDWESVAESLGEIFPSNPPKTSAQCRHKIEKLRQKYRAEKQRYSVQISKNRFLSTWVFFESMDKMENSNGGSNVRNFDVNSSFRGKNVAKVSRMADFYGGERMENGTVGNFDGNSAFRGKDVAKIDERTSFRGVDRMENGESINHENRSNFDDIRNSTVGSRSKGVGDKARVEMSNLEDLRFRRKNVEKVEGGYKRPNLGLGYSDDDDRLENNDQDNSNNSGYGSVCGNKGVGNRGQLGTTNFMASFNKSWMDLGSRGKLPTKRLDLGLSYSDDGDEGEDGDRTGSGDHTFVESRNSKAGFDSNLGFKRKMKKEKFEGDHRRPNLGYFDDGDDVDEFCSKRVGNRTQVGSKSSKMGFDLNSMNMGYRGKNPWKTEEDYRRPNLGSAYLDDVDDMEDPSFGSGVRFRMPFEEKVVNLGLKAKKLGKTQGDYGTSYGAYEYHVNGFNEKLPQRYRMMEKMTMDPNLFWLKEKMNMDPNRCYSDVKPREKNQIRCELNTDIPNGVPNFGYKLGKTSGAKRKRGSMDEMVSSIKHLGEGFVRMETMKMEMAREMAKTRMDMELKRNELILKSQRQIVDTFVTILLEKNSKKQKKESPTTTIKPEL